MAVTMATALTGESRPNKDEPVGRRSFLGNQRLVDDRVSWPAFYGA
jgi:hypothetical protein